MYVIRLSVSGVAVSSNLCECLISYSTDVRKNYYELQDIEVILYLIQMILPALTK